MIAHNLPCRRMNKRLATRTACYITHALVVFNIASSFDIKQLLFTERHLFNLSSFLLDLHEPLLLGEFLARLEIHDPALPQSICMHWRRILVGLTQMLPFSFESSFLEVVSVNWSLRLTHHVFAWWVIAVVNIWKRRPRYEMSFPLLLWPSRYALISSRLDESFLIPTLTPCNGQVPSMLTVLVSSAHGPWPLHILYFSPRRELPTTPDRMFEGVYHILQLLLFCLAPRREMHLLDIAGIWLLLFHQQLLHLLLGLFLLSLL